MANGWKKWKKLRCVVEVKVPPKSAANTSDLMYHVQRALDETYDSNIPLKRSCHQNHIKARTRVMHYSKVRAADRVKERMDAST